MATTSARKFKWLLKSGGAYLEDVYGGAAIIMALMTPIIIGGLAFGAELASWELTKRQVQNAADVAAFAAGTQVRTGETGARIVTAALSVAVDSGYTGGSGGIIVEAPPSSAPNAADGTNPNGNAAYVYVMLTETANRNFTKFFSNSSTVTISSAALAHVESGRKACILALHPTTSGAVETGGSTNVTLTGCDIAANSISPSAITATGNGSSVTTDCISAVGNVSVNSTYHLNCPAPIANAPKTVDPYAGVSGPASASCTSTKTFSQFPNAGSGPVRCYSGNGGGVTINQNTTLSSDVTYVFENTGGNTASFRVNGNRTLSGTRVTLYFKGKWDLTLNGGSTLNITAPKTGPYSGLALFGDRNSEVNMDLSGNTGGKIVGAVYSPNFLSDIVYTGSSNYNTGECTQVIGGTVKFSGSATFTTNCTNSGTPDIKTAQTIKIVG